MNRQLAIASFKTVHSWWMLSFSSCGTYNQQTKNHDSFTIVTFKDHTSKFRLNCQLCHKFAVDFLHCHNRAPNSKRFYSFTVQKRCWWALVFLIRDQIWTELEMGSTSLQYKTSTVEPWQHITALFISRDEESEVELRSNFRKNFITQWSQFQKDFYNQVELLYSIQKSFTDFFLIIQQVLFAVTVSGSLYNNLIQFWAGAT